jgi:hypothetical protein
MREWREENDFFLNAIDLCKENAFIFLEGRAEF